jgi:ParB family chromosome partitioning protein
MMVEYLDDFLSRNPGMTSPGIQKALEDHAFLPLMNEIISNLPFELVRKQEFLEETDAEKQAELARKVIKDGLSVRETEKLAAEQDEPGKKRRTRKPKDPDVARVEADLKEALGTRVNIKRTGRKGKIEIEFFSRDELERLIEMLESLGNIE